MTREVYVVGGWVPNARAPRPISRFVDPDEARARYEATNEVLVIDALTRSADGRPRPRWVLGFGASGGARAQFFDALNRLVTIVDYSAIDGRLFRQFTTVYAYPDEERYYRQSQAVHVGSLRLDPDGTGHESRADKVEGHVETGDVRDASVSACWTDRPAFGQWADLTDPEFGLSGNLPHRRRPDGNGDSY